MQRVIQSSLGEIKYEEGFWTGKRKITINGVEANKIDKKTYSYKVDDELKYFLIKGSYMSGLELIIGNEKIQVVPKTSIWEYILFALPLIFVITWGNSYELCAIFPVVGGGIGGGVSALISCIGLIIEKGISQKWAKALILIASAIVAILVCYVIAIAIIG